MLAYVAIVPGGRAFSELSLGFMGLLPQSVKISRLTVWRYGTARNGVM
jgi:hypothetical protein